MRRRVLAGGLLLLLAGCSVVLGLDPPTYDGPISTPDATVDTTTPEAAAPILPGKLDDPARWSTYKGPGGGYVAGPFDGRFIYFLRSSDQDGADAGLTGSRILRYDTQAAAFDEPKAWTTFDPEVALGTTGPHVAATLEGKHLVVGAYADNVFLRFDTTQKETDFGFSSSWERYDATELHPGTTRYSGAVAVADGGTLFSNGTGYVPLIHRGESFDAGWESTEYDGGTFPGSCGTTSTGLCSPKTAFLTPAGSEKIACLARYDVSKTLATGFDSFDLTELGDDYAFISGGVMSPQHLYLTQYNTRDAAAPTRVFRRPLEGALDAGWEGQPTNGKNPLTRGFIGGVYDGRYIYFSPYPAPTTTVIFARYDTTLGFNDANAWDIAAGAAMGIPANRYWGAVFDGQYVYYSAYVGLGNEPPTFARFKAFDTKMPVPPACHP